MSGQIPKVLVDCINNGNWRQVSSDCLRQCWGEELFDLTLFPDLNSMRLMSSTLDHGGYVDDPEFCMMREHDISKEDPRLDYSRALFIAGSIVPGDDVFVAIEQQDSEESDPPVLVFDWRREVPYRWTERGKLSEFLREIAIRC